jgi:hypothetical protein
MLCESLGSTCFQQAVALQAAGAAGSYTFAGCCAFAAGHRCHVTTACSRLIGLKVVCRSFDEMACDAAGCRSADFQLAAAGSTSMLVLAMCL